MPPTNPSAAGRKEPTLTAFIGSTVSAPYCFYGNIPLLAKLRDCKRDASDDSVEALQNFKRSCLPFGSVLARKSALSYGQTAILLGNRS
jgi:hypothetical protein